MYIKNEISWLKSTLTSSQNPETLSLESNGTEYALYSYDRFNRLSTYRTGTTTANYNYFASNLRADKTVNGKKTSYIWNGQNLAYEKENGKENTYSYDVTGIHSAKINGKVNCYVKNTHGDVVSLTDSNGTKISSYDFDAFGNQLNSAKTDNNPFRYCGEYFDDETGLIYLRNRYYDTEVGRFITEDPAMDGVNWYAYCGNNPIIFIDPTGNVREAGYVNGKWVQNPDAYEFDRRSSTYKILVDLGNRWNKTNDENERERLHNLAEDVRDKARKGTPYMYGQDIILETIHANAQKADEYTELYIKTVAYTESMQSPYVWFVTQTCSTWDYKWNEEWQVPYKEFNGMDMNKKQRDGGYPKNWAPWIYFDGQILGADKFGNLNLGYVGKKMGFDGWLLKNFTTMGAGDGYWVQYGIDMAIQGR